jgi:K+-transporting ATPase KdpF subunit
VLVEVIHEKALHEPGLVITGLVTLGVLGYLVYSLLRPERF